MKRKNSTGGDGKQFPAKMQEKNAKHHTFERIEHLARTIKKW